MDEFAVLAHRFLWRSSVFLLFLFLLNDFGLCSEGLCQRPHLVVGRPVGRETEFWHLAEQELRNEDKSSPTRTPDTL
jgi:hypothetical protein